MKFIRIAVLFFMTGWIIFNGSLALGQEFSAKTIKLYQKGVKLLDAGSADKAEKVFLKIIETEDYGRSYYQLAVIELNKKNTTAAYAYFYKSLALLKEEQKYYRDKPGYDIQLREIEAILKQVNQGIIACGGMQALQPEVSETKQRPDRTDSRPETGQLDTDQASILLQTNPVTRILLYNNGEISTYYSYNEHMIESYRLPSPEELERILTYLMESDEGNRILTKIKWEESEYIRFISSYTYYDDFNNHLSKGYSLSKNKNILKETAIELGDAAAVILVKK